MIFLRRLVLFNGFISYAIHSLLLLCKHETYTIIVPPLGELRMPAAIGFWFISRRSYIYLLIFLIRVFKKGP